MEADEIARKVEETGEEWPQLYGLLGEKGDEAVDIFHYSDPDNYHLPMADEVYNTVIDGKKVFLQVLIRKNSRR